MLKIMFVSDHPSFINVPENDETLWRYMDLTRFITLLQSQSLYFSSTSFFPDLWEGEYGLANQLARPKLYGSDSEKISQVLTQSTDYFKQRVFVNCWNQSPYEAVSMWSRYVPLSQGIAISTTWEKLTRNIMAEETIYGAKVQYIDHDSDFIPEGNRLNAFLTKQKYFSDENEVRLLHYKDDGQEINLPGINVRIDLGGLIEGVHLAPGTPAWAYETVSKLCQTYGLETEVFTSVIDKKPR